MKRPSRKKFGEVLRCLKAATKNEKLPWVVRIRACELILCCYGVELPQSSGNTKRRVRELVEESAFERQVREQVEQKVSEQVEETLKAQAEANARAFLGRMNQGETTA